jgi:ribosomal-protein-serine acetyltransferase
VLELVLMPDVRLRLLELRDADELYRLMDASRADLAAWMPWAAGQTLEGTLEFIQRTRRQVAEDDGIQTAIECGGEIAGVVGLHSINWLRRTTSIGYWLAPRFRGRGVMTAAVRAYVDQSFGPWGLNRLELSAAEHNVRSRAVAERLGFTREGLLRSDERIGDAYHDIVVYSVLAAEWPACAARAG